jgi:pimeloyl-ACP methyl ester carboxylesterase
LTSPFRLWPEISAALPDRGGRFRFLAGQALRCAAAPIVPSLMASRIHNARAIDFREDCSSIRAATLVISGEDSLDRVVPVPSTRAYASYITGARYLTLQRTGHIGLLTQPAHFADVVSGFVHANHQ